MKSKKYLLIVALLICGITSCDVINEPFTKGDSGPFEFDTNKPNILLEEFTGHGCINCPVGSKIAHNLEQKYKGNLFIVAIHSGSVAEPDLTDERYNYDFRISEGIEIGNLYGVTSFPIGMINRRPYNNQQIYSPNRWQDVITDFLSNNTKQLNIKLLAEYNDTTRTISANVKLNYLALQSIQNKLSVWILEDNVIKYQKSIDPPFHIPDYQHNDVFRYSFNGAWGEVVSDSNIIPVGFEFSKDYFFTVPQEKDWNPNNLRLIAFVYDDINGVKQVIDTKIETKE